MYRVAIENLYKWKESKHRKPLIIEGARQVGKTWLMKEFGEKAYADTVYINFDSNSRMAELFASDLDTDRLILGLELYAGRKINPDNTLLIFDEVQEVPRALSSLKYFYENAPQYHIVCAGSLLPSLYSAAGYWPMVLEDMCHIWRDVHTQHIDQLCRLQQCSMRPLPASRVGRESRVAGCAARRLNS
jgi:hypothetical protein